VNDRRNNKDREALISNEIEDELAPDEAADLELLADILGDPATWAEPSHGLEDEVVDAVVHAQPRVAESKHRKRRYALPAVASVAATILILVGAVALTSGGTSADFTANLAATQLVPGASGSATVVHNAAGFRIALDAHGLKPLPPGQYYQGWLKNDAGTLVPIGTFSASDGKVTLWSGVSPKEFPKLTVTIEATDNDQTSSGVIVLAGDIRAK
jgi:hypothetical protein